ncbi:MAG: ROK family glucokinase [Actinobacteria bacterium]|jgi:glucokinase|nr:ROK family glucokinase [Micrococcales bacterium]MCB0903066.1 ROK family glucokinase [Actinomycetota bacterium]MCO5300515.1 ROK family glucokinase [Candidatus Nanopelagicales bacterium]MCB9428859.1 ROK family glucokinase [Actinomycetota bacterium]HPE11494.1 ROK family glucokinase [Actinomycetota bacterium]
MGLTVGIDIGGTKIAAGVVDEQGRILARHRVATAARDAEQVEETVAALVLELREEYDIEAVGIGAAGFVDEKRSRVNFAPNLGWKDEPLRKAVEAVVGIPVVVENDANAAAWAESRFGAGRGLDYVVTVTVGTGIGAGIVLDGSLYRGRWGAAGEFGHLNVDPGGRPCACGNRGCWEQYASGNALVREARYLASERRAEAETLLDLGDGTPEGVQGLHVTQAARKGDPVALAAFDFVSRWLGQGMADVTAILDPECFVIGGGVSEAGDVLLASTVRAFSELVTGKEHRELPKIVIATLGNAAGLVGAADLARYR